MLPGVVPGPRGLIRFAGTLSQVHPRLVSQEGLCHDMAISGGCGHAAMLLVAKTMHARICRIRREWDRQTGYLEGACLLLTLGLTGTSVMAAGPAVPADLQAVILKKIVGYDRELRVHKDEITFLIVANQASVTAGELASAFNRLAVKAEVVSYQQLNDRIGGPGVVVYVESVEAAAVVSKLCQTEKVLSSSGHVTLVEKGQVAIGIGLARGKPQIVVHMPRLVEEGHALSAQLLALARVIR